MGSRMIAAASTRTVVGGLLVVPMTAVATTSRAQAPAPAAAAPAPAPAVLEDGANAKPGKVDGLHHVRYIEIFLAAKDPVTGKMVAPCYNSTFSPAGVPASKDTAPQAKVEGLDPVKLKTQYGVLGASLNGPKLWMIDWGEAEVGAERDFNGIRTAWVAQLNVGAGGGIGENAPYAPMTIARKSGIGWNKGTTVLLLDDADGNTWVMKGFQLGLHPAHTYEQLVAAGAGNFKKLPAGWKFRIKKLEKDLVERPEGGVATIMPDEFYNVYDKTGPGMTNYKP